MAIAFVRQNTAGAVVSSASTVNITITAPTNGDCLVAFIGLSVTGVTISSITQTGATWVKGIQSATALDCEVWYALNVAGAGTTVTVNFSSSSTFIYVANITEFSGVATSSANDGAGASNTGKNTTAASTTAFSTSNANDVILVCEAQGSATAPSVNPSTYSPLTFSSNSTLGIQADYKIVSGSGAQSASWTITKASFESQIYALKASSGTQFTQSLTSATAAMGGSIVRGRLIGAATVASVAGIAKRLLRSLTAS